MNSKFRLLLSKQEEESKYKIYIHKTLPPAKKIFKNNFLIFFNLHNKHRSLNLPKKKFCIYLRLSHLKKSSNKTRKKDKHKNSFMYHRQKRKFIRERIYTILHQLRSRPYLHLRR